MSLSEADISANWTQIAANEAAIANATLTLNQQRTILSQKRQEEVAIVALIRASRLTGPLLEDEDDKWQEVAQLRVDQAVIRDQLNTLRTQIRGWEADNETRKELLQANALEGVPLPTFPEVPAGTLSLPPLYVAGRLDVAGDLAVQEDADVSMNLGVNTADISGAARLASTLDVSGAARLASTLDVSGALQVVGASTLAAVNASGAVRAASTVDVSGALQVVGASSLAAVNASGAVRAASSVDVSGALQVVGASTVAAVTASGDIRGASRLDISGASRLDSSLDVSGITRIASRMDVSGALRVVGVATLDSDLTVGGNLTVSGTQTILNTQTLEVQDNIVVLNRGMAGAPPENLVSGLEINRGTSSAYRFVFSEDSDTFRVGVTGELQAVATREDNPTANAFPIWNSGSARYDTAGSRLSVASSRIAVNGGLDVSGTSRVSSHADVSGNLTVVGTSSFTGNMTLPGGAVWATASAAGALYSGTADPSATNRLNYNGNLHLTNLIAMGNVTAYSSATASDARLKTEVVDMAEELDSRVAVAGMRPVAYTDRAGKRRVGFIAQELREVVPHVVNEDPETGLLSVAYGDLVAVLAEELKAVRADIALLKARLA